MSRSNSPEAPVKTLGVPEAGAKYFQLSRNGSYAAAKRGDLPVIRIGRLLRVPVAAVEWKLAEVGIKTGPVT